jgi:hypothetical protein
MPEVTEGRYTGIGFILGYSLVFQEQSPRFLPLDPGAIRHCEVRMLTATVSGSFHRHMEAITRAVHELAALSVRVLSPADPRVVAAQGEFLFVASDRIRSVRLVQDRHLESIRAADFLWLVCPDGYVGQSASMEIGYAAGAGVRIFALRQPTDLTLREYVNVVPDISTAARRVEASSGSRPSPGILIDPRASVEQAHDVLERIKTGLTEGVGRGTFNHSVYDDLGQLRSTLALPPCVQ